MMLAHPEINTVFDFAEKRVCTLVIENPRFFRAFLQDIKGQIDGDKGRAVLSEDNMPIEFSKYAEVIDNYLPFEMGRKTLMTKIVSRMEETAMDEMHYCKTLERMGELERYLKELSFDLPCEVQCSKINISKVLRAVGIEIADDYENDPERMLDYMELTRELERDKLFLFVNLRSYYSDEEGFAFCKTVLEHELSILLVDSVSRDRLPNENRITIDMDLCEF